MQKNKELFVLSPFEMPDVYLALETIKVGANPILHLGRDKEIARQSLKDLSDKTKKSFGICVTSEISDSLELPENVNKIFIPFNLSTTFPTLENVEIIYQVFSLDEAEEAIKKGVKSIVLKGNEGAGKVAYESSFVLLQGIKKMFPHTNTNIYIQGGMGVHTSAAALAMGAQGIIYDNQVALFPECRLPKELKNVLGRLSGSETILIDSYRILVRKNSPSLPLNPKYEDIVPYLGGIDLSENILPMGQDVALSIDFVEKYKTLDNFIYAVREAAYGHLLQAKSLNIIGENSPLAQELGIRFPIAQGPMARVSDVPEFADKVTDAGALPFIALSLMIGQAAQQAVSKTAELLKDKPWGIGILGFAPSQLREEQMKYILENKPPVLIIAGGRPTLAKPYEKEGIKVFLHVPSVTLLDMFMKEGSRNFIFEGRESGGHVGPLSSMVLWEKQIFRLIKDENPSTLNIFFAGGIHDAFSSAFISIMSASLAAKGAKIGVLMGSSYLFTKEAVETGAILKSYQEQSVNHSKTILLEAAPGQETRALPTPFTEHFTQVKEQLFAEGLDSKEVWLKLEEMNLGRQRIAAKGIERQGSNLVSLNDEDQVEKGVFMIGQISSLRDKVVTLDDLHSNVAIDNNALISKLDKIEEPLRENEPVKLAIVGMAGIFPQAKTLEEYWKNILLSKNCVTEVPDSRWNKELFYNPDTRDTDFVSSKWGGFIPTIDFDPLEFGIPPQSLASIEPVQLLSLLVAKRALEDAGYDMATFDGENTSVIIGAEGATELAASYGFRGYAKQVFGELPEELKNVLPKLNEDSFPGVLSNVVAGRITNRLNLGGSNFTVDAACASSLAAMDIAYQELQNKRSDIVVLGGADLHNGLNDYLMFSATYALSKKGRCASFDSDADGIALGESVSMIILKRLEDAERDGDRIYAVIRGTGGSSDGKNLGMTAPNKKGQMKALQRAYKNAGVLPSEVELIEAHGTGTVVGDKTELSALTDMFLESGATTGQTHLGSVKTQIGHTKCAAGLAGVIKAALSMYYGVQPPTINLSNPNSFYNKETSPFIFNTNAGIWGSERRISGVSAFGFGGTNFHVVMENYQSEVKQTSALTLWPSELFIFRGDTLEEAKELAKKVQTLISVNDSLTLRDIAYSLAFYNQKEIQITLVAKSIKKLKNKLESIINDINESDIYLRNPKEGKVAFLFSGQGSQRINMARDLLVAFPSMRKLLLQHPEYDKILYPNTVFDEESKKIQQKTITQTQNAQPALGIVDLAIADFLRSLGIEPDMVAGHSYGELPALCFSGAFDSENLVSLSRKRAESILNAIGNDKGKMIAVGISQQELEQLLAGKNDIWPVNFNSPKQTILAGTTFAMNSLMKEMGQQNISYKELSVDCAFHSPLLEKSKDFFAKELEKVSFKSPSIPVWSNTTADLYPTQGNEIKTRLSEHLIKPVLFNEEIQKMYTDGARIFIETGPGKVLINLAQSSIKEKDSISIIQTEEKGKEGINYILNALAKYIATGRNINIEKLFDNRNAKVLDLDQPEIYKKKPTIWFINGHNAVPSVGPMPANGALPITEPVSLNNFSINGAGSNLMTESDHIMLEYLGNMKTMIQNQRDVMLGYLGHTPSISQSPSQQVINVNTTNKISPAKIEDAKTPMAVSTTSVQQPSAATLSLEEIKSALLDTVSEKTGYPIDMLGLEMDLEADLSIDSIKRMEIIGALREKLNLKGDFEESEDAIEKMASIKTLNGVIGWVEELVQSELPATLSSTEANLQTIKTETVAASPAISAEHIKNTLLETVSEKTGYPTDMLGLDLDLEADLSIDSIKRMEIIGSLREKLNMEGDFEESEDAIEKMASIKTLNGVIGWIEDIINGNPEEAGKALSTSNNTKETTPVSFDANSILELEQNLVSQPEEDKPLLRTRFELEKWDFQSEEKLSIKDKNIAITDDGGEFATIIQKAIEKQGGIASIISKDENDLTSYDGLIVLDISQSPLHYSTQEVFSLIKKSNLEKIQWIFSYSDVIGSLQNTENISELKKIEGYPGLIKSIAREFSAINCRAIISHTLLNAEEVSQIILDELISTDISAEVVYKDSQRLRLNLVPESLSVNGKSNISLDKDSVVVVFGGAQGITSELTAQLADEYPCHYILVGRSPVPSDENKKYSFLKDKNEIRKHLISEEKMTVPAEIEKKAQQIEKENQIAATISNIEKSGSKVTYVSLDVTDENNLRNFIRGTYEKYGKIDGIIHAAGLLVDKLLVHKTADAFNKVYSTKINPLHVILDELRPDIKFIVLFSSIASVYGNRGQSDYAAANSVFDLTSWVIKDKLNARILTVNWGPWKGAGMVSSALENEFNKRGVALIPLKQGGQEFIKELKFGHDNQVLIMGGGDGVKQFFGI